MTDPFHTVELSDPAYERDGLRIVTVKSRALGRRGDVTVWVPEATNISGLLILLHGVWGSHWVWTFKGGVHRIAERMTTAGEISPMVIAMPSDGLARDGSGYLAWQGKENVERWIVEEIPAISRIAAPELLPGAPVAIGGLSMGGYGALRLGSKYAEHFCAISAHSAITDILDFKEFVEEPLAQYVQSEPHDDLSALHWIRSAGERMPPLRFDCGTQDSLLESNRRLHDALHREHIPHEYVEYAGGHEWSYWQANVAETLRFADRHLRGERQA